MIYDNNDDIVLYIVLGYVNVIKAGGIPVNLKNIMINVNCCSKLLKNCFNNTRTILCS